MTSRREAPGHLRFSRLHVGKGVALGALTVAVYAVPYLTGQYYVGIATEILIFGLWAVGLNVLVGTAGLYSLGHAALLGISAYTVIYCQTRLELSFLASSLIGVLVTMAVAFAFAVMAMRATAVYFLMITLAQGMLVWGVAQSWVSITDGDNGLRGGGPDGALAEYYNYYWLTASIVLVSLVGLKTFLSSQFGLRLRGVRDSNTRMASLGYNVLRQRIIAFMVAALPAAIAGSLYVGYFHFISPTSVTVTASVEGLLMVILGGMSYFLGPMLGALLVIGLRNELTTYTDRWPTVLGVLLVLSVLFARQGLSVIVVDTLRRIRTRRRTPGGTNHASRATPHQDTTGAQARSHGVDDPGGKDIQLISSRVTEDPTHVDPESKVGRP
jgi:branched-chain amino acid transport system permease protein